ncbi:MAG: AAA family ATPase [Acidobacteriaceae bacterium]
MLIEFRVANFRSFRDRQTLSLVAGSGGEHRAHNVVASEDRKALNLLRTAVVYGPNAAGKSNLFRALHAFQWLVQFSASALQPGQPLPVVTPFRLVQESSEGPSEFEITFLNDDQVRYQYGCAVRPDRVVREWLIAYPQGRPQRWFERNHEAEGDKVWWFGGHFLGDRAQIKVWQDSTRDNALFLSTALQLNNTQLRPVFTWLTQRLIVLAPGVEMNPFLSLELLRTPDGQQRVMDFMRAADIDIDRLELKEEALSDSAAPLPPGAIRLRLELGLPLGGVVPPGKHVRVLAWHKRKDDGQEISFNLNEESDGTRKLFEFVGGLLRAMDSGATLCIDELDRSLHPQITRFLVKLFHHPQHHGKNAQLIFSTHDVTLMTAELLRRDQIWFVEKSDQGASRLYPLIEYSPRKGEALERGYLKGRYGALPLIGLLGH